MSISARIASRLKPLPSSRGMAADAEADLKVT
jgi:hypothetical protein